MSEAEIVRGGDGMHHEAEMVVAERLDIVQLMQRDKFFAAPDEIPVADHRLLVCEPNQLCTGVEREINARDGARVAAIITVQSVLRVDLGNDRILLHFFKYMPHKSTFPPGFTAGHAEIGEYYFFCGGCLGWKLLLTALKLFIKPCDRGRLFFF